MAESPGINGLGWFSAAGLLLQMWGSIQQGKIARIQGERQRIAAEFAKWQADRQAGTALAISQRQAVEENRQASHVASRALAVAAASGAGVSDPTMVRIIANARGEGAYLWDVDGKKYIDYVGSWGPAILGHAHPAVLKAVTETARNGLSFGAPTAIETEMAQRIKSFMPSIEKLRMVSSGTEATMSAIRLARGYTGRDKIIKF